MGVQVEGYGLQAAVDAYSRKTTPGEKSQGNKTDGTASDAKNSKAENQAKGTAASSSTGASGDNKQQDAAVQQQINELVQIQNKVIAHEQAHMAVGGSLTGGASYSYTNGPDGKRYITGGEVSINIPSVKEPEDKIRMMVRVRAAALAPADPSPQDRSVAASASAQEGQAAMELARKRAEAAYGKSTENKTPPTGNKPKKAESGNQLDMSI